MVIENVETIKFLDLTLPITQNTPNQPPVIDDVEHLFATEGEYFSHKIYVSDPDGDKINIISHDETGAGLIFLNQTSWLNSGNLGHDENGYYIELEGTPEWNMVGTSSVTVRVADNERANYDYNSFDEVTFDITVQNVNNAPIIHAPSIIEIHENDDFTFNLMGSDKDLWHGGETLTYSSGNLPEWICFRPMALMKLLDRIRLSVANVNFSYRHARFSG